MTSVSGTYLQGKTRDDVKYFHSSGKATNFFPRNIGKFFENLSIFTISSANISSLTKPDLQFLGNLKTFGISSANIASLETDVFDYTPNIEAINLSFNKITNVERGAFDQLKKLSYLNFQGNLCGYGYASNRPALLELIPEIERQCN